jgi:drug/metabolite transporter (DMT)-like permease
MIDGGRRGIAAALGAALLFGAGVPAAKVLSGPLSPLLLAGLLYLGSGVGLALYRLVRGRTGSKLPRADVKWLAAAVIVGGMVAPVLLMWGLSRMPAATASLLLNAEGALTALLAWFVFRENFDRRIALGMALVLAGAAVLSWPGQVGFGELLPALAVLAACLAWAVDNNLTRKVSLADATFIAMVKGLAAGTTNLGLALAAGAELPGPAVAASAALVGFVAYGVSLALFVIALRELGTARTGAYFSTAPFAGAVLAIAFLGEAVSVQLGAAGLLMAAGVWLHVTERHQHEHTHGTLEHEHEHGHDEHHQHGHDVPLPPGTRHTHRHRHEPMTHTHPHFPDAHHRHDHQ